jgi:hypothetical protein
VLLTWLLVERGNTRLGSGRKEEERFMPTYITSMNWTDQGVKTAKDTVQRRDQAESLAQKHE